MRYDPKNEQIMFLISGGNPTAKELAEALGLRAKSSVTDRLSILREHGLVTWEKGKHRSYRLTEHGKRYMEKNYG
jgi:Mn-dependent DtxR family transcriptional regulator